MATDPSPEIRPLPLSQLEFDRENPRLIRIEGEGQSLTDAEVASALLEGWDPEPIGRSLAEYGFFPSEPLIVFPGSDDSYIVAEGNRRLLAARLLVDEELRESVDAPGWDELAEHMRQRGHDLSQIPCQVVESRAAAAPVIGYRHIVGIAKWDAYDKAAFVAHLLGTEGATFESVSDLVGESQARVKRYLRDFLALREAEESGIDVDPAQESFGRFERAMTTGGVRGYVEAKAPGAMEPDTGEVVGDMEAMRKLMGFLYGLEDGTAPLFSDTRRIDDLASALDSQAGREILESERDLDRAFDASGGRRELVLKRIDKAISAIAGIGTEVREFAEDEEVQDRATQLRDAVDGLLSGVELGEAGEEDSDYEIDPEAEHQAEAEEGE